MTSVGEGRTPVLVVIKGVTSGGTVAIGQGPFVIGREHDADLRLTDLAVSRYHAVVTVGPDGVASLRDLGSSNGTYVNGDRISSERRLVDGDEIAMGAATVLRFTYRAVR